jgi:branched-chain amino acid transport system substrate-binding protein
MSNAMPRRVVMISALAGMVALLAACGGNGTSGSNGGGTTPASGSTPQAAKVGGAGIASNPRPVKGLEKALVLDDGLAMWKTRPANEDRTGVTADTIKLGRYSGKSGPTAAFEAFWDPTLQMLIKRVNDAGGIHGRKLELITRDDQFDPSVTVQVTQQLVEQDKVFALFMPVGNAEHQAVGEYEIKKGVPSLWTYDGETNWVEPKTTQTEFPGLFPDLLNGKVMADYVLQVKPGAKVAAIYEDDSTGKPAYDGFKYVLEKGGGSVTAAIGYDLTQTDMTAQTRQAVDSKPDWIMYYGVPTQAQNMIKALHETIGSNIPVILRGLLPAAGISQYMDGVTYVEQSIVDPVSAPDNPVFGELEAVANETNTPYQNILSSLALGNFMHLVRALEMAGPDLTRQGLVEAMNNGFDGSWTCPICIAPTILNTNDHWTYEAARIQLWHEAEKKAEFKTDVLDYETSHGHGLRGNFPDFPCAADTCPWKKQ